MESLRTPYIEKGTPNKVDEKHKGDFKLFKKTSQYMYYKQFIVELKQQIGLR